MIYVICIGTFIILHVPTYQFNSLTIGINTFSSNYNPLEERVKVDIFEQVI